MSQSKLLAKVGKNCHIRRCVAVFVHINIFFPVLLSETKQNYTKLLKKMYTKIIPCKFPERPYKLNSTSMCKKVLACIFHKSLHNLRTTKTNWETEIDIHDKTPFVTNNFIKFNVLSVIVPIGYCNYNSMDHRTPTT